MVQSLPDLVVVANLSIPRQRLLLDLGPGQLQMQCTRSPKASKTRKIVKLFKTNHLKLTIFFGKLLKNTN